MSTPVGAVLGAANHAKGFIPLLIRGVQYLRSRKYPKARRKTIGLAVAIVTEDERERLQIQSDFIDTLDHLISTTNLRSPLSVVVLANFHSQRIKTLEHAQRVLNKTGCRFLLWGKARNRKVRGEDNFVLDLQSVVQHSEIPSEISKKLSEEMTELLPQRRAIGRQDELNEFELNAASVELSAKYVLGVAAHLSYQVEMSIEIFEELNERLRRTKLNGFPTDVKESVKLLTLKVPIQLAQLHFHEAGETLLRWRKTRLDSDLEAVMAHVTKAERYVPDSYRSALLRAIYHFVKNRDVKRARKVIAPFKEAKYPDATWAIDEAFLLAYSGSMKASLRYYRIALKKLGAESALLLETEEFILWALGEEPSQVQLHFCLGLINYWGKQDFIEAKEDFSRFLATTQDADFSDSRELAKQYLEEMENKR